MAWEPRLKRRKPMRCLGKTSWKRLAGTDNPLSGSPDGLAPNLSGQPSKLRKRNWKRVQPTSNKRSFQAKPQSGDKPASVFSPKPKGATGYGDGIYPLVSTPAVIWCALVFITSNRIFL
jgi:hypothetical protein